MPPNPFDISGPVFMPQNSWVCVRVGCAGRGFDRIGLSGLQRFKHNIPFGFVNLRRTARNGLAVAIRLQRANPLTENDLFSRRQNIAKVEGKTGR
jgi:hypothetical protein